jgi:hypothetical protein
VNPCPVCGQPLADTAYVCHVCARTLTRRLLTAAVEWPDLETTLARQDAVQSRPGSAPGDPVAYQGPYCRPWCEHESCRRAVDTQASATIAAVLRVNGGDPLPHEGALPFSYAAAEAVAVAANTFGVWAHMVSSTRGSSRPTPVVSPARRPPIEAEPGDEQVDELERARRRRRRTYCGCCDLPIDDCQNRGA